MKENEDGVYMPFTKFKDREIKKVGRLLREDLLKAKKK